MAYIFSWYVIGPYAYVEFVIFQLNFWVVVGGTKDNHGIWQDVK